MISLRVALSAAAGVLVFLQAGYLALRVARRPDDRGPVAEWLALSYGLGVGLVTTQMLLFSLAGIRFTAARILMFWVVAWVLNVVLGRRRRVDGATTIASEPTPRAPFRLSAGALVLLIPVTLTCLALLFRATFMPVWVWDSWAVWDLKARAFFHAGGVVPFVSDQYYSLSHLDYPPLVPLAGTFMYLALGTPHGIVQIVPVLFYAGALVVFFATLRRLGASQVLAAALTAGLAFLPNFLQWSQHFQSESAFVFYALTFTCFLYLYLRELRRWYFVVAALSAGFLTQTRAEGWLLVIPGALLLIARVVSAPDAVARRTALRAAGGFMLMSCAAYAPWLVLRSFVAEVSGGVTQVSSESILAGLYTLPDIVVAMLQWMADTSFMGEYTLLFPLAIVFVLMNWRRYVRPSGENLVLLTGLVSVVPAVVVYMVTLPYSPWLSVNAMGRYLMVLTVMAYLILSIHTVEAVKSAAPGAARLLFAKVALALTGALLVVSLPTVIAKIRSQTVSWDVRSGPQGWVVTPSARLDADLVRTIRITARAAPGTSGRLTLAWKRLRGEYVPEQRVTTQVRWTGLYQRIVVKPPWRGMVEEFVVTIDGGPGVFVQSIGSEPRWLSMLGLALRSERSNLPALAALMLVFLAAMGALSTRADVQRALAGGFAAVVLVFWLAPEVAVPLAEPINGFDYARPIGLTRTVRESWSRLGGLAVNQRINELEAEMGRPEMGPLMKETAGQCGRQGDVVVFASPGNGDVQHGAYVYQRSGFLLFPSKVRVAHEPAQLAELLGRSGPLAALIVYDTPAPGGVGGKVVYSKGERFMVVCDPRALTPGI